jgi:predicted nucleotidyltransferase
LVSLKDIRALARQIGKEFHPQQVILFGSYARGTATEDSDVDLLVVMQVKGKPVYKAVEIRLAIDVPFALDLLVRTPLMVRKRIAMGDSFMEDLLREGKVLYEGDHRRMGRQGRTGLRRRRAGVAG